MARNQTNSIVPNISEDKQRCLNTFDSWSENEQIDFVKALITRMAFHQQEKINSFLEPILQRDFISELSKCGLHDIAYYILSFIVSIRLYVYPQCVCTNLR